LLGLVFLVVLPLPKNSYALDSEKVWQDFWQTKNQQAQDAYNNKQYDKAAELFESPDWKAAAHYKAGAFDKAFENLKENPSANGLYNQGNALAQSGQLKEALDAYKQALKLNPNDEDAKYNKELVEKALEQQKQEKKQDQQQDQDKKQDSQDKKNQEQKKDNDKSGQAQDKDQENKDEQKESEQKPEQKSEQSQKSTEQQPEKEDAQQQKEKQADAAKPDEPDTNKDHKKPDATVQPLDSMSNEEKQANEQWLKRIPDDPAGLLKRKFKYQYDQRGQR